MPQLTVRQAAERVGISRQTMFRHIREGRVSATLSHSGQKQIEITELLRAFGTLQPETVTPATTKDNQIQSQSDRVTPLAVTYQIEIERLKAQLTLKSSELELAKERIAELKQREHDALAEKNRLLTLVEQQTRLLEAPNTSIKTKELRKQPSVASTHTPSKNLIAKEDNPEKIKKISKSKKLPKSGLTTSIKNKNKNK